MSLQYMWCALLFILLLDYILLFVIIQLFIYSLKGSRFSTGVVPRDVRLRIVELNVGSAELFLGVCMPDGVEVPLTVRL